MVGSAYDVGSGATGRNAWRLYRHSCLLPRTLEQECLWHPSSIGTDKNVCLTFEKRGLGEPVEPVIHGEHGEGAGDHEPGDAFERELGQYAEDRREGGRADVGSPGLATNNDGDGLRCETSRGFVHQARIDRRETGTQQHERQRGHPG